MIIQNGTLRKLGVLVFREINIDYYERMIYNYLYYCPYLNGKGLL